MAPKDVGKAVCVIAGASLAAHSPAGIAESHPNQTTSVVLDRALKAIDPTEALPSAQNGSLALPFGTTTLAPCVSPMFLEPPNGTRFFEEDLLGQGTEVTPPPIHSFYAVVGGGEESWGSITLSSTYSGGLVLT